MNTIIRTLKFMLFLSLSVLLISCTARSTEGTVEDIEGNSYRTIKIGKQTWMAENLRVKTFNDGEPIPLVTDGPEWYNLKTAAYCWYNNDSAAYSNPYGVLYNFHAISAGKICPAGWRVPTQRDFKTLISIIDQDANFTLHEASTMAGGMLKAKEAGAWAKSNTSATNESGFSALPGGCRSWAGHFSMQGTFGYYGSSTDNTSLTLRSATGSAFLRSGIAGYVGISVRCIKEE